MGGKMEKIIMEKLNEIAKILMLAQQNVEYIQKIFFMNLKKSKKLNGLENRNLKNLHKKD